MMPPAKNAHRKTAPPLKGLALLLLASYVVALPATVHAHETRPAYIEITQQPQSQIWSIVWKTPTLGDPPIYLHPVLADAALENLPGDCTEVSSGASAGATLCHWEIQAGAASLPGQRIAIEGLAGTSTDALVRVNFADGTSVTRLLRPEAPSWTIVHSGQTSVSSSGIFPYGRRTYSLRHRPFAVCFASAVDRR